ncbi:MAG: hypothetical protein AABX11_00780 [Nanoarchaeota archaeon]
MDLLLEELYCKTIEKKELSQVSKDLVIKVLTKILSKQNLSNLSSKDKKLFVKKAREELRDYVGRFQYPKERKSLLAKKNWEKLLNTHSSTKERLLFYPQVIELVYSLNPKSILDLGCGLNPLAFAKPGIIYYASDINLSDIEVVESYFEDKKIEGSVFPLDITSELPHLPKTDVTLMFKLLDFLEKKSKGLSERILKLIPSKTIIVSFSSRKLSGKRMNHPQREWFERMCTRLGFSFEVKEFDSEIFYLITK